MRRSDRPPRPPRPSGPPARGFAWLPLAMAGLLLLPLAPAAAVPGPGKGPPAAAGGWEALEAGLEFAAIPAPRRSSVGDSMIRVLRIDPGRFEFRLLNASAPGEGTLRSARGWAETHGLVAAINASMYQADFRRSVSLMRTREHVNNPRLSKDKAVLAFDRRDGSVPEVQILDRECQDFEALRGAYGTLVQSIRMLGCDGRNVWAQQPRRWSTAAIGTDRKGRVLFIHVRSPYSTHDLIEMLRQLPLDLTRAMYVEGGPESQLWVGAGGREYELVGSFESGFVEDDERRVALPIPNVIGVARRAAATR